MNEIIKNLIKIRVEYSSKSSENIKVYVWFTV